MFYCFTSEKGENATQAHIKLCAVYGKDCLTERQCQNWFAKFRSGNFNVKDAPRSVRPVVVEDDKIKALIEANRHYTTREVTEILNISQTTMERHLHKLGYVSKLNIWVSHELKEIHLTKCINACDKLLKNNENDSFLKRIVTGDEKWIVYDNVVRKR